MCDDDDDDDDDDGDTVQSQSLWSFVFRNVNSTLSPILVTLVWPFVTAYVELGWDHMDAKSAFWLCYYWVLHFQVDKNSHR
jgi:hypothetical protein